MGAQNTRQLRPHREPKFKPEVVINVVRVWPSPNKTDQRQNSGQDHAKTPQAKVNSEKKVVGAKKKNKCSHARISFLIRWGMGRIQLGQTEAVTNRRQCRTANQRRADTSDSNIKGSSVAGIVSSSSRVPENEATRVRKRMRKAITVKRADRSETVRYVESTMGEDMRDLDEEKKWLCNAIEERAKQLRDYRTQEEQVRILRSEWERLSKIPIPRGKATNAAPDDFMRVMQQTVRASLPAAMCSNLIELRNGKDDALTKVTLIVAVEEEVKPLEQARPFSLVLEYNGEITGKIMAPWAKLPTKVNTFPANESVRAGADPQPRADAQDNIKVPEFEEISEEESVVTSFSAVSKDMKPTSTGRETHMTTETKKGKEEEFPMLRQALTRKREESAVLPTIKEVRPVTPGSGLDLEKLWGSQRRQATRKIQS